MRERACVWRALVVRRFVRCALAGGPRGACCARRRLSAHAALSCLLAPLPSKRVLWASNMATRSINQAHKQGQGHSRGDQPHTNSTTTRQHCSWAPPCALQARDSDQPDRRSMETHLHPI